MYHYAQEGSCSRHAHRSQRSTFQPLTTYSAEAYICRVHLYVTGMRCGPAHTRPAPYAICLRTTVLSDGVGTDAHRSTAELTAFPRCASSFPITNLNEVVCRHCHVGSSTTILFPSTPCIKSASSMMQRIPAETPQVVNYMVLCHVLANSSSSNTSMQLVELRG